jgi:DNA-binding LacI/PurR family transcriptional regulator
MSPIAKPNSEVASERRITLADIASEAGVSLATVSKVLNGRSDVSAPTRARVEQLLAGCGYLRRASGSGNGAARMVELVFHELESEWAIEIIRGVERVARMLIRMSENPDTPVNQRFDLATSLVVRESTAPPK